MLHEIGKPEIKKQVSVMDLSYAARDVINERLKIEKRLKEAVIKLKDQGRSLGIISQFIGITSDWIESIIDEIHESNDGDVEAEDGK